jgi:hypothetical protein
MARSPSLGWVANNRFCSPVTSMGAGGGFEKNRGRRLGALVPQFTQSAAYHFEMAIDLVDAPLAPLGYVSIYGLWM